MDVRIQRPQIIVGKLLVDAPRHVLAQRAAFGRNAGADGLDEIALGMLLDERDQAWSRRRALLARLAALKLRAMARAAACDRAEVAAVLCGWPGWRRSDRRSDRRLVGEDFVRQEGCRHNCAYDIELLWRRIRFDGRLGA